MSLAEENRYKFDKATAVRSFQYCGKGKNKFSSFYIKSK